MNYYYSDKLGQFKEFSHRLNKMIDNGSFNRLSSEKRSMLISRLKRLFNQLLNFMPELKLKHILAAAAIFVLSLKISSSNAQTFGAVQTNPFGLATVDTAAHPTFVDIDGDGDFDAFVGDYYGDIIYFQNTGSNTAPAFAAAQTNPFGLTNVGYNAAPTFVDIDGDGDKDLFVGEYYGVIKYFQNTSPTGIKENEQTTNVTIYPNPAKDKFAVQFNGLNGSGSVTLEVTNSIGQIILKEKAAVSENGYSLEINTAAYDKGLYFVKLKTKDDVIIRKLVVE
ncbi:MAG: T9SS type A sorting domain-containing protein [Bacteroidetes bacterium]|nr:T9SS type A sorting domain-containing protein [Bacteroidota bacterium]